MPEQRVWIVFRMEEAEGQRYDEVVCVCASEPIALEQMNRRLRLFPDNEYWFDDYPVIGEED